jgi:hypothetical protein
MRDGASTAMLMGMDIKRFGLDHDYIILHETAHECGECRYRCRFCDIGSGGFATYANRFFAHPVGDSTYYHHGVFVRYLYKTIPGGWLERPRWFDSEKCGDV